MIINYMDPKGEFVAQFRGAASGFRLYHPTEGLQRSTCCPDKVLQVYRYIELDESLESSTTEKDLYIVTEYVTSSTSFQMAWGVGGASIDLNLGESWLSTPT